MPQRNVIFADNEIYHLFNRSIAKQNIFSSKINTRKAFEIVDYYRFPQELRLSKFKSLPKELKEDYLLSLRDKKPIVEIYSFALMPNHFHFLLKQLQKNGIRQFVSNFQNSFAKIFNLLYNREGSLFQSPFKAKRIETDEQFIHTSRYIHLNPVTGYLIEIKDLMNYPLTSFRNYAENQTTPFIDTDFLLGFFGSKKDYSRFVKDQSDYQRKLDLIKDLILE